MLYVILGHRIANTPLAGAPLAGTTTHGGDASHSASPMSGIDQLGLSMLIAAAVATPAGIGYAAAAFTHPLWLAWGIGVGLCSSVIPYVTDQLAMARLNRSTFALMLALLPAVATIIGFLVLGQAPTAQDLAGIALVIIGVAIHHEPAAEPHQKRTATNADFRAGPPPGTVITRVARRAHEVTHGNGRELCRHGWPQTGCGTRQSMQVPGIIAVSA
jgi:inner membrane transporter RhtA